MVLGDSPEVRHLLFPEPLGSSSSSPSHRGAPLPGVFEKVFIGHGGIASAMSSSHCHTGPRIYLGLEGSRLEIIPQRISGLAPLMHSLSCFR